MDYDFFHYSISAQNKTIKKNNFTYHLLLSALNKHIRQQDDILDIGCGAGTLCLYYASKGHKVLGIDISKRAVITAQESAKNLGLGNVKFENRNFPLEVPEGRFDFIIFTEVIEHLQDDRLAIERINTLLNKGGKVLLSTPSIGAPLHKIGYSKGFDKRVGHLRRYSILQLTKLLEEGGFKILETKKIEGILRNFLFLSPVAGKIVRLINRSGFLSDFITAVDNGLLKLFGNSNIIIVAQKI